MRPMSLTERGVAPGGIDVAKLLAREATIEGHSPLRLPDYAEEICASGLPGLRGIRPAALGLQLDSYLARIVDRDLPEEGVLVRRPQSLMAWLTAYAAATSTPASYTAILGAATAGETDKPSRAATQTYRDLLARIWVLDPRRWPRWPGSRPGQSISCSTRRWRPVSSTSPPRNCSAVPRARGRSWGSSSRPWSPCA